MTALRAFAVWLVIIAAETIHGIFRGMLLVPWVGDMRSRQIGVLIGSLIIFAIAYIFVSWLNTRNAYTLFLVGASWVVLTVIFEVALGRLVVGATWDRILSDYNIFEGGFMFFGLLFVLCAPYFASLLKRSRS